MHPNKKLRHAIVEVFESASMAIDVDGVSTLVKIKSNPPSGGWQPDSDLPGIYCFVRSERVARQGQKTDIRTNVLDVVLQAKGSASNAVDQLDDMQLEVERLLSADATLGGFLVSLQLLGSEVFLNQGEVVFAARRVSFEPIIVTDRSNPSVA